MTFVSDEQRKAVMAKLNKGKSWKVKGKSFSLSPSGKHRYAVYATIRGKRERHSHYLTKPAAERFAKLLKADTAKTYGFRNVEIKEVKK